MVLRRKRTCSDRQWPFKVLPIVALRSFVLLGSSLFLLNAFSHLASRKVLRSLSHMSVAITLFTTSDLNRARPALVVYMVLRRSAYLDSINKFQHRSTLLLSATDLFWYNWASIVCSLTSCELGTPGWSI